MRLLILALLLAAAAAAPAHAWWQYAEWGFTPSQVVSASSGQAVPCRAEVPVCAPPPGGLQSSLFVERLTMVGMPASASFAFDGNDKLEAQRLWRDERRGTIITAIPAGRGTMLLYRPAGR